MRIFFVTCGPDDWGKRVRAATPHMAAVAYTKDPDLPSLRRDDDASGKRWLGWAEGRGEVVVYLINADED